MPYDDLPETDEPLIELETPEEDTRCQLWEDTSPMINLLSDSTGAFQLESPKITEKPVLSDLKGIVLYINYCGNKKRISISCRSLQSAKM